jgi:hypothetical protein
MEQSQDEAHVKSVYFLMNCASTTGQNISLPLRSVRGLLFLLHHHGRTSDRVADGITDQVDGEHGQENSQARENR